MSKRKYPRQMRRHCGDLDDQLFYRSEHGLEKGTTMELQDYDRALAAEKDNLDKALMRAELAIRDLRLDTAARVKLEHAADCWLVFDRFDKTWALRVRLGGEDYPVRSFPIPVRIEIASKIPDLVAAIYKERESEVFRMMEASKALNAFIDSLQAEPEKTPISHETDQSNGKVIRTESASR